MQPPSNKKHTIYFPRTHNSHPQRATRKKREQRFKKRDTANDDASQRASFFWGGLHAIEFWVLGLLGGGILLPLSLSVQKLLWRLLDTQQHSVCQEKKEEEEEKSIFRAYPMCSEKEGEKKAELTSSPQKNILSRTKLSIEQLETCLFL